VPVNGSLSTDISVFNTQVTARCSLGFRFPGDAEIINVQCVLGQIWNDTVPDCIRKLKVNLYNFQLTANWTNLDLCSQFMTAFGLALDSYHYIEFQKLH
jgi:hypothetical protein